MYMYRSRYKRIIPLPVISLMDIIINRKKSCSCMLGVTQLDQGRTLAKVARTILVEAAQTLQHNLARRLSSLTFLTFICLSNRMPLPLLLTTAIP